MGQNPSIDDMANQKEQIMNLYMTWNAFEHTVDLIKERDATIIKSNTALSKQRAYIIALKNRVEELELIIEKKDKDLADLSSRLSETNVFWRVVVLLLILLLVYQKLNTNRLNI